MQKALTDKVNSFQYSALQKVLGKLQPNTSNDDAKHIFIEAKTLVESLSMPAAMNTAIEKAMEEVGSKDGEKRLLKKFNKNEAWEATKKVWSSLFGLRPWVSLAKAKRSFHDLNMAVLVQELVSVKYAFVLHTVNPFTHDKDELYGEIVLGRGETLVGNYPGRAMSFSVRRTGEPIVHSFPSKSTYLKTQPCLIFRSDSNGEDLEGFAGAGLFESICARPDKEGSPRYHRVGLIYDRPYRQQLLKRIAQVGWAVETHFAGMPQDIEGCVDDQDRIFIVQSRPQV
jgi:alpha-glucan,water dikinase